MDFFKNIAGFRSGNKIKKIIAMVYYVFCVLSFIIVTDKILSDVFMLSILLLFPSVILNVFSLRGNSERKKVFAVQLAAFIIFNIGFSMTTPDDLESEEVVKTQAENVVAKKENKIKSAAKKVEKVKNAELHFINTGNSDAILIKQGNKAALIDGGDNDDEQKVVNYLKEQEVSELEYVFATHPHADHIGGLDAVVNAIPIKNLYVSNGDADTKTYSDFINAMANKGLSPSVPLLNSEFKLDNSIFKVLSVANSSEPNNNSLVLLYTNGKDKVLLMGDAEADIESNLNPGDIDLLKIGHHGSHSSTTDGFLEKTTPEYAVIQVGEGNSYGHPHQETMSKLESLGIEVHRNDECGNIIFKSTGKGLEHDCSVASYNPGKEESKQTANSSSGSEVTTQTAPAVNNEPEPEPQQEESYGGNTVYANGGRSKSNKYHSSPTAHNMEGAIPMSQSEAQASGYVACKRCY